MGDKWYSILTPAQDLDSPHWVAIERVQPGGAEAVILGLRLRQMAVQAGFGGLLAKPSGQPMSLNQITLALGYTPERVQHGLNLLHSFDLLKVDEEGGVWSEDPVVLDHFDRQTRKNQKLLPGPSAGPGRPRNKDGAATGAERQKKYLLNKKAKGKSDEKMTESDKNSDENSAIISVTPVNQFAGMVKENWSDENSPNKEVNVIKTSSCTPYKNGDEDDEIDISPALVHVPAPQSRKVGDAVRKALATGHTLHTAHQAIDDARREATPGRPWIGLALYKLEQLALPAPTKKKSENKIIEVLPEQAEPAADPEAEKAFQAAMLDRGAPLYRAMYDRITDFAREMGPGNMAFVCSMREAYDTLMLQ